MVLPEERLDASQFATAIDGFQNNDFVTYSFVTNHYMWITFNNCRQTITTAKDIISNSGVVDIYRRIIFMTIWCSIFSLVTTAIDTLLYDTAIDYDSDSILRSTIEIVTTKYVVNAITFHCHGNRTIDVCCYCR